MSDRQKLAIKLLAIQDLDDRAISSTREDNRQAFYEQRSIRTYEAMALALSCGIPAGIRLDPDEPEWPVAFIELPTGQISYHLAQHTTPWDQHTTEEKQVRMLKFIADTLTHD